MDNTEIVTRQGVTAEVLGVPWGQVLLGECLKVMSGVQDGVLDVVYSDPPFFTGREHRGRGRAPLGGTVEGGGEGGAGDGVGAQELRFEDRWQGGRHLYLEWLEERVREFYRLLKPSGVLLLHLDWHAVHYAKVMCDEIFGDANFQNELIWYYQTGGASKDRFSRKHDTILMYSKGEAFYFDGKAVAIPRTAKAMKRARSGKGARIAATDTHKNPDDVITVPALNPMAIERTGYPTQKPVALLEMLIQALCPVGGSVGDFMCGSGTTLVAAERVGRKWMGSDENPAAVEMARRRVAEVQRAVVG